MNKWIIRYRLDKHEKKVHKYTTAIMPRPSVEGAKLLIPGRGEYSTRHIHIVSIQQAH